MFHDSRFGKQKDTPWREATVTQTRLGIAQLPKITEPLNLLQETVEGDVEQLRISEDQDARVGHKSADSSFFGYKTHLALTEERIIRRPWLRQEKKATASNSRHSLRKARQRA